MVQQVKGTAANLDSLSLIMVTHTMGVKSGSDP